MTTSVKVGPTERMITKDTQEFQNTNFHEGEIILIDKSLNHTSFNVIYKLRKGAGIKKAGHAGTLDPKATGLLIICTGKKTKEISSFQDLGKTYTGIITLGKSTASMDSETEFIEQRGIEGITDAMIYEARDSFLGVSFQIPPMYSAVKIKGKSLYKYARKGIELERAPRQITISKFEITKIDLPDVHFEISCTKGTYIRVIANDLGQKLKCGGYLSSLRRTQIGEYSVDDAFTIDEFMAAFNKSRALNVEKSGI